jgi:hypothetical protein
LLRTSVTAPAVISTTNRETLRSVQAAVPAVPQPSHKAVMNEAVQKMLNESSYLNRRGKNRPTSVKTVKGLMSRDVPRPGPEHDDDAPDFNQVQDIISKPWPGLASNEPWPPESPPSCGGYFGNGFSRAFRLLPQSAGGVFQCRYHPTQTTHICEAGVLA